jgi:hypothetical protein
MGRQIDFGTLRVSRSSTEFTVQLSGLTECGTYTVHTVLKDSSFNYGYLTSVCTPALLVYCLYFK